ncbi:MAG: hypothetical protein JWQ99_2977 [Blastococcus sp.]|jgi:hypothetical protein|nr:hypothetical protein [Blastococcus sp.]
MAAMHRRVLSAALAGLLLAGCSVDEPSGGTASSQTSAASTSSQPSRPSEALPADPGTTTLVCAASIDGSPPPAGFEVVLGVVALPTGSAGRSLQVSATGDPSTPALFAKTGLLVHAGHAFELAVPAPAGNGAAIGWGNRAFRPAERFVVPECADQYGTGWLAYPGGYWVDQPVCLPVTVRAGGREQVVDVGVGAACTGQQPPA